MADDAKVTPTGDAKINNQENNAGADPNKKSSSVTSTNNGKPENGEKTFDESVFENPQLWTHPRFKSLNERAKMADKLEKQLSDAEEAKLADAKKFEELATKRAQERDEVSKKYTQSLQDNRILIEATKIGVVDTDAVLKLVDRSNIHIDDNGVTTGVIEAVQALVATKPYLKGRTGTITIGSPTNPGADSGNQPSKFKLSQLQDAAFFREHEKEIHEAYKNHLIEDDMTH
jgi:hypothetical protein